MVKKLQLASRLGRNVTTGFGSFVGKNQDPLEAAIRSMASESSPTRGSYQASQAFAKKGSTQRQDWVKSFRAALDEGSQNYPEANLVFVRRKNGTYVGRFVDDSNTVVKGSKSIEWPKELAEEGSVPLPHVSYNATRLTTKTSIKDGKEVTEQVRVPEQIKLSDYTSRQQKAIIKAMEQNVENNFARVLKSAAEGDEQAIAALTWYPTVGRGLDQSIVRGLKNNGWSDEDAVEFAASLFSGLSPRTLVNSNADATAQLVAGQYIGKDSPINRDTGLAIVSGIRRGPGLWRTKPVKTDNFTANTADGLRIQRLLEKGNIDINELQRLVRSGQIERSPAGTVDMWAEELLVGVDPFSQSTLLNLDDYKTYEAARKVFENIADKYELPTYMVQSGTWDSKAASMLKSRPVAELTKLFGESFTPDSVLKLDPGTERTAALLLRAAREGSPEERELYRSVLRGNEIKKEVDGKKIGTGVFEHQARLDSTQDILRRSGGVALGVAPFPLAGSALAIGARGRQDTPPQKQDLWSMARSPYGM
jgi:hypothetical protein